MKIRRKKRGWKRVEWEIRYWLASNALQGFVRLIPLIPFKWTLFNVLEGISTKIGWQLATKYKKKMFDNLTFTFQDSLSEQDKERIARESFRNMIRGFMETLFCIYTYRKHFDPRIELEGRKNLEQTLALRKGAIAVTAHLGIFTLIGAKLNASGFPNTWIMGAQNHPRIAQVWAWMAEKVGSRAIVIDSPISFHKAILRALSKGNIVTFVCDENQKHGGVLVEFLGRPMALPVGPAVYHLKTGAPILPIFMIRQGGRRHKVIVDSPLEIELSGDEERDVFTITDSIARVMESFIKQYPGQWSWIGKRRIRTRTKRATFLDERVNHLS
jgi:KDO2-lipid IV(A) lauroyltransferase